MAYKYRILSGSVLLGLLGLAAYSIANPGHYEGAPMLIGDYPKLMSNDVPEVPSEDEDQSIEEPKEENDDYLEEEVVFPESKELPAPVEVSADKPIVAEEAPAPAPKEEKQPEVSVNEETEAVVDTEEEKAVVDVEIKPESEAPAKETNKIVKGENSKKAGKGKSVSKGPLTVNENPKNKGKYAGYSLGQQWGDRLLDTSNAHWWITNERRFVTRFDNDASRHQIRTKEFRDMLEQLGSKQKSELDGSSLMKLCASNYERQYRSGSAADPYISDIWNSCLKGDRKKINPDKSQAS